MARRFPRPDKSTPMLEPDGKTINQQWFDYLGYLDSQVQLLLARGLMGLPGVTPGTPSNGQMLVFASGNWVLEPTTAPTDSQVLIWSNASQRWVPGAN